MRTGMIYGRARVEVEDLDELVQRLRTEHPSFKGRKVIFERCEDGEGRGNEVGVGIGCIPDVGVEEAYRELQRLSRATRMGFTRNMWVYNKLEGIAEAWTLENDSCGLCLRTPYVVEVWMTAQMSGEEELRAMKEHADLVAYSQSDKDGRHTILIPREELTLEIQGSFPKVVAIKGFSDPDPKAFLEFYDEILDYEKPRPVNSPGSSMIIQNQTYHRGRVLIARCAYPKGNFKTHVVEGRR